MKRPICKKCNQRACEKSGKSSSGEQKYRNECWKCRSLQNPTYAEHYTRYHRKLKTQVIEAYGGKCECCAETERMFLTIDHINNGGNIHRKEIGGGGYTMYRWLKKNSFPKGFRLLCFNCNCGRSANGGICPHKISLS
jgi:hypothetical protein